MTVEDGFRVLLVFGALWWMYGGYVWLANARTPSRTTERLLPVPSGRGRFAIQPAHFTERHGALVIIVLGESVVDIGIGAEGHAVTVSLALSAVLGLALTAALWWAYFGADDDERAERAMMAADPAVRPALALAAYFYAYIPMLLGIVALASGVKQAIVRHREHAAGRAVRGPGLRRRAVPGRQRGVQARAADRRRSATGWPRRPCALAASAVGVTLSVAAEIALLTVIVAAALAVEQRAAASVDA